MIHIFNESEETKYDQLVIQNNLSFLQGWNWAKVKYPEWSASRISIDNFPVQILLRKIPLLNKYFAYIPRGFNQSALLQNPNLLDNLVEYTTHELNCSHLVIDPDIVESDQQSIFKNSGFLINGDSIQPNQTSIIEISGGIESVLNSMKAEYRRDYRKSLKNGVRSTVYKDGELAMNRFLEVMKSIFSRTEFKMHNYDYFEKIWNIFSTHRLARIYTLDIDDQVIGSLFVIAGMGNTAFELYGGLTNLGKKMRVGPLLRVVAIEDLLELGIERYDQWGVAKRNENGEYDFSHPLYNISIFKQRMGGKHIDFLPQQIRIFDRNAYNIYKYALFMNSSILRARKIFHL
jgi:peptidoglycan pentaglycine glycine transferase (the first glycine)